MKLNNDVSNPSEEELKSSSLDQQTAEIEDICWPDDDFLTSSKRDD